MPPRPNHRSGPGTGRGRNVHEAHPDDWGSAESHFGNKQLCLRLFLKTVFSENDGRTVQWRLEKVVLQSQWEKLQMETKEMDVGKRQETNRREAKPQAQRNQTRNQPQSLEALPLPGARGFCLFVFLKAKVNLQGMLRTYFQIYWL